MAEFARQQAWWSIYLSYLPIGVEWFSTHR
jgi:hypothetical protein